MWTHPSEVYQNLKIFCLPSEKRIVSSSLIKNLQNLKRCYSVVASLVVAEHMPTLASVLVCLPRFDRRVQFSIGCSATVRVHLPLCCQWVVNRRLKGWIWPHVMKIGLRTSWWNISVWVGNLHQEMCSFPSGFSVKMQRSTQKTKEKVLIVDVSPSRVGLWGV